MNWLTNYIKPKLESLVKKRDVPKNLWIKCQCGTMIYYKDYEELMVVFEFSLGQSTTKMKLKQTTKMREEN